MPPLGLYAVLAGLVVTASCGNDSNSDAQPGKEQGTEGAQCFPNGTCMDGLVCLSDLCVDPGTGGAGGVAGAAGSGGVVTTGGSGGDGGSDGGTAGIGGGWLSGSVGNVSVVVAEHTLVTTLSGSFGVFLHFDEHASDAASISFSPFSLVSADTGLAVLDQEQLSVVGSEETPVQIQPGESVTIGFQIGDQIQPGGPVSPMEVAKDDYATLCNAGDLKIVGAILDYVDEQQSIPVSSATFIPSGC